MSSRTATQPFGHFDDARREYVIATPLTPRPWENRIWNDRLVVQATHHGTPTVPVRDAGSGPSLSK